MGLTGLAREIRDRAISGGCSHPSHGHPADEYLEITNPRTRAAIQRALGVLAHSEEPRVLEMVLHLAETDAVYETLLARLEGSLAPPIPEEACEDVAGKLAGWCCEDNGLRGRALAAFLAADRHAAALRLVLDRGSASERVSGVALTSAAGQMDEMLARLAGFTLASEDGGDPLIAASASLFTLSEVIRRAFRAGAAEIDASWEEQADLARALGLTDPSIVVPETTRPAPPVTPVGPPGRQPLPPSDRASWISLLKHDVPAFNAHHRDLPLHSRPDLRGADLRGLDLSTASLRHCDLTDADLSGCVAPALCLQSCRLVGTRLTDVTWVRPDDREAVHQIQLILESPEAFNDYRKAVEPVLLTSVDFSDVVLGPVDFRHMDLLLANLEGADLTRCCLWGLRSNCARLKGAELANAHLYLTSLEEADLSNADLTGCRIEAVKLGKALAQATAFPDTAWDTAFMDEAMAVEADFSRCTMLDVSLTSSDLRQAVFRGAKLDECDFSFSSLIDADFRDARLTRCNFMDADVAGANFEGATMDPATLDLAFNADG